MVLKALAKGTVGKIKTLTAYMLLKQNANWLNDAVSQAKEVQKQRTKMWEYMAGFSDNGKKDRDRVEEAGNSDD